MSLVSVEVDSKVNELFAKINITQKFKNESNDPIELKIHIFKNDNLIFSSFQSKVIKKEKAEIKYTDSISSGNAAIFVYEDPFDTQKIIINMGNIPANEEVIFIFLYLNLFNLLNHQNLMNSNYLEICQFFMGKLVKFKIMI